MTVDRRIRLRPNVVSSFLRSLKLDIIFFFLGEAEREEAQKKADKEQRRAMRKKKAEQKANQLAGKETDSEDEFEPRSNPLVGIFNSISILY